MRIPCLLLILSAALPQAALPAPSPAELLRLAAKPQSAEFRKVLGEAFPGTRMKDGLAYAGQGPDFLFAIESAAAPKLFLDEAPGPGMTRIKGTDLWIATARYTTGRSHSFYYEIGGKRHGGNQNVPAYLPESYEQPGVPQGKLSEKIVHKSAIYDGMESDYWIYVPAQYDGSAAVPVMIWLDGHVNIERNSGTRLLNVVDNLTHRKKIPVMIQVFTSPGEISSSPGSPTHRFVSAFSKATGRTLKDSMRSTQYDTVTDRYVRFLREEILAEVGAKYKLRRDAYSVGISGASSGAVAAFNAAWQHPEWISRVLSQIGTYTSIQWYPGALDGGNIFPFAVRKTPRKNIRVWLQDGSEDIENEHGSWPLQNIQMANSLKMQAYDFRFTYSNGAHSREDGSAQLPLALPWLWRDYDLAKTGQIYEMDPAEKEKPYFRVKIYNREAN